MQAPFSRAPRESLPDAMAFLGTAALATATAGIFLLRWLFGATAGLTPFIVIAIGHSDWVGYYENGEPTYIR